MRQTMLRLIVVMTALAIAAGPPIVEAAPAKVLYLTQSAAFPHPVLPHSEAVFSRLAAESDQFDLTVSRDASTLTADTLSQYDVVVFFTTGELPMDAAQKAALLAYVRGGGGFVGVHSAADTFYEWPGYLALIGGYFDGHPWHQEVTVRVEDGSHPATRHLGESFRIHDEIYQYRDWSRDNVNVLLSLDVESVDMTARGIKRSDRDFALAWTRDEGAGRVFYTALGHRPEVWDDERFQRHLLEGINWAMGNMSSSTAAAHNTLTDGGGRRRLATALRRRVAGRLAGLQAGRHAGRLAGRGWRPGPREPGRRPGHGRTVRRLRPDVRLESGGRRQQRCHVPGRRGRRAAVAHGTGVPDTAQRRASRRPRGRSPRPAATTPSTRPCRTSPVRPANGTPPA